MLDVKKELEEIENRIWIVGCQADITSEQFEKIKEIRGLLLGLIYDMKEK